MVTDLRKINVVTAFDPERDAGPRLGEWYWASLNSSTFKKGKPVKARFFVCVTHVGSNYVELQTPGESSWRVHLDEFPQVAQRADKPDDYIAGRVEGTQERIKMLMGRVKELTASLAVNIEPKTLQAAPTEETQALAVRGQAGDMQDYKQALVKAKQEQLPELFKEIEQATKELSKWMKASSLPLRAQAESMKGSIKAIDDRIFNVELYAGLIEEIERIADGPPAERGEKIHLLQRRCYMDEECLARYEVGGMEFKDLSEFDEWLVKPANRDRILPFPRAIVAFQVRRRDKVREAVNISDFFRIIELKDADKLTFLYLRNGEQVYRLSTEVEFGADLFPDMTQVELTGKLWAKVWGSGSVEEIISDARYQGLVEDYAAAKAEYDRLKAIPKAQRTEDEDWATHWPPDNEANRYSPFDPSNVYFDDIAEKVAEEMQRHNRIALILQGLLDRSPVFLPHPGWHLWEPDGFEAAVALVYDDSRALSAGDKPDFEAYRARLNKAIAAGTVTIGQEVAWEIREAEKECARRDRDYRDRGTYRPERFRPYGDPGPGTLARVWGAVGRKVTYRWFREKRRRSYWDDKNVQVTFTTDKSNVLNVDAYTPGDYRQFFDDPRTRADYLQWAPLLLEAEEFHAGNRKLPDEG